MQNAVSRQKQLSVVFVVANVQKQGAEAAECIEAEYATMFQELVQSAEKKDGKFRPFLIFILFYIKLRHLEFGITRKVYVAIAIEGTGSPATG